MTNFSFFNELKRRNVFRVAFGYVVLAWLLVQIGDVMFETFGAPDWVMKVLVAFLVLGFPVALFLSWVFELTPEGIKKEKEVDRGDSITQQTGRKLDFFIIGVLVVAVGYFAVDKFLWRSGSGEPAPVAGTGSDGERHALAVLPFTNMSADSDNEFFADGISEEILNLVAGVDALEVASRTSAFAYKGSNTPIPDIARDLKVQYVLEGSVRKAGNQVRVTAQLIDARNDRHLWSETYDRTLNDIFAIQDEIAGAIGEQLQVQLLGSSGTRVTSQTLDPAVYEQFLEARYRLRRRNPEDIALAIGMLESVAEREPEFARGLVTLAEALLLNEWSLAPEESRRQMERAADYARRAQALDPDLSGIYMVLGQVRSILEFDQLAYLRQLDQAIELEPREPRPYHWRSIQYQVLGFMDEAFADAQRALELDPNNANVHSMIAALHTLRGERDLALHHSDRCLALGNPWNGLYGVAEQHLADGNFEGARATMDRMAEVRPHFEGIIDDIWRLLRQPEDRDLFNVLLTDIANNDRVLGRFLLVGFLSAIGESEIALVAQQALFSKTQRLWPAPMLWHDRNRSARQDPRFIELAEASGAAAAWDALGPPPDCRKQGDSYTCGHGSGY